MNSAEKKIPQLDGDDRLGHRKRLRQRFLQTRGEGVADYELLELALFQAIPRADVKPLAKTLLKTFDNFAGVLSASPEELMRVSGMGEAAVVSIKTLQASAVRLLQQEVMDKPVLSSWQQLLDYCRVAMGNNKVEQFRILFLDNKNRLIADELQQEGTINHTPLYPREVVKRALELSAASLILVHNHPSGDTTPSRADIDMTKRVKESVAAVDITIHDHLIVSPKGHFSFKSMGLI